jgi:transposase-like protein
MQHAEFLALFSQVARLDDLQRKALLKVLSGAADGREAIDLVEAGQAEKPACPHCGCQRLYVWGRSNGLRRWKCKDKECRRTFNALTGTPLARLRKRELWLEQTQALADGISLRKVAARCGVNLKTAFRWRHRFLKAPKDVQPSALAGIVEADETYFLKSAKGSRKLVGRLPRKRGGKAKKTGLSDEHVPVLIARDRHGATLSGVMFDRSEASLKPHLEPVVAKDALLVSDGAKAYGALARTLKLGHVGLNISAGELVKDGIYHIQNANSYTSGLKEWMRRFKGIATKNLPTYLGWRRKIETLGDALTAQHLLVAAVASPP